MFNFLYTDYQYYTIKSLIKFFFNLEIQKNSLYLCGSFFKVLLIKKGGGIGPVKPWQPYIIKVLNPTWCYNRGR